MIKPISDLECSCLFFQVVVIFDIMGLLPLLCKSDVLCIRSFMFVFFVFLHNLSPACRLFDKNCMWLMFW